MTVGIIKRLALPLVWLVVICDDVFLKDFPYLFALEPCKGHFLHGLPVWPAGWGISIKLNPWNLEFQNDEAFE